jgi:hypothetical protein
VSLIESIIVHTRNSISAHIKAFGKRTSKFRTWQDAANSEKNGLLLERTPSGYSNWFAIKNQESIWWIYSDSSDGGIWGSKGLEITGYSVPFDSDLSNAILALVKQQKTAKLSENPYANIK